MPPSPQSVWASRITPVAARSWDPTPHTASRCAPLVPSQLRMANELSRVRRRGSSSVRANLREPPRETHSLGRPVTAGSRHSTIGPMSLRSASPATNTIDPSRSHLRHIRCHPKPDSQTRVTLFAHTCPRCGRLQPPGIRCPTCPGPRSGSSRPQLDRVAWQKTRRAVRLRDGNRCATCGTTQRLSVHHITPHRLGGTDATDNLVTLCSRCHAHADSQRSGTR
jgi:hypothetical protein